MYAPSGAVITQFPFSFPVPGGGGLGLGLEGRSWRLIFFFFNGMVVGWGILLLVVLVDCLFLYGVLMR